VNRARDWLVAGALLVLGRRRKPREPEPHEERIVARGPGNAGSELLAIAAFGAASLFALAFVVVYAIDSLPAQTQLLGTSLGLCFASLAAALIIVGLRVVPDEETVGEYHAVTPEEQHVVERIAVESGEAFTRKRLLTLAAGGAAGTLGLALVTPVLSLGPALHTAPFYETPWQRGRRLVDEQGRPLRATELLEDAIYTAFPEGADRETFGAPIVVVRLPVDAFDLPSGRSGWAPAGIVAYSKICTHAGCAVALYRTPKFDPAEPAPALVCPCHYSTFDPAAGGKVTFGPAGRALPQLPLAIDGTGFLRAGGNFSGPVGPSWWGVRLRGPT
jgi:ubiquinol-cytochrome c reductase iron-sulfur subunit